MLRQDWDPPRPTTMVVLVRDGADVASWPLAVRGGPDLEVVDQLARLQLAARRVGYAVRLEHVCPDLSALIDLVGLGDVLGTGEARPNHEP